MKTITRPAQQKAAKERIKIMSELKRKSGMKIICSVCGYSLWVHTMKRLRECWGEMKK